VHYSEEGRPLWEAAEQVLKHKISAVGRRRRTFQAGRTACIKLRS
jgi:hypothetical protein